MPRQARVKSFDSIYHIMVRSIGDTLLYRSDDDKDKYLKLLKKYQEIFAFKVYAYCVMDTHAHIVIDVCGADISKIMHGVNQSYAQYFNKKYKRNGHLFQDRFKSKIVDSERYLLTLSGYIHNNPSDLDEYRAEVEKFKYSSLGIYLGNRVDNLALVDTEFILEQFSNNKFSSKKLYRKFIGKCRKEKLSEDMEFKNEKAEYRSERKILLRDAEPDKIAEFVSSYIKRDRSTIHIKYIKSATELKALTALLLRGICDIKERDICAFMGNITQTHVSRLCKRGLELIEKKDEYKNLMRNFIEIHA